MDPESAKLALKLQLDDIDRYLKVLPDSTDSAIEYNESVAFKRLRQELLTKWLEINGQCAAMRLLGDEHANQTAFRRLVDEERQAEGDHDMACRLAGVQVPARPARNDHDPELDRRSNALNGGVAPRLGASVDLAGSQTAPPEPVGGAWMKRPAAVDSTTLRMQEDGGGPKRLKIGECQAAQLSGGTEVECDAATAEPKWVGSAVQWDEDQKAGESSKQNKGKGKLNEHATHAICSSCLELHPLFDVLQLDCKQADEFEKHAYCRECLKGLFDSCISDPSLFPPRCCSKIVPLFSCVPFLPKDLIARFVEKTEELDTPNRTYCGNPGCAKWIKPGQITAGVAHCPHCSQTTCASCKNKQHEGLCPEDSDVKQLMTIAQEKKWKTCPKCKNMVELAKGCYHITCRCRYEFCYLCLAKWKKCRCDVWNERNIWDGPGPNAAPAQGQANGNIPPVAAPIVPAAAQNQNGNGNGNRFAAPAANVHHLPRHQHEWERVYREDGDDTECDDCGDELPWINFCDGCGTQFCQWCLEDSE